MMDVVGMCSESFEKECSRGKRTTEPWASTCVERSDLQNFGCTVGPKEFFVG